MDIRRQFKSILEPLPGGLGWTIVRLPFDATRTWPQRNRMRVKGTIQGAGSGAAAVDFRTSLFGFKEGGGQFLLVNKKMQREARVGLGGLAEIIIEPDLDERTSILPPELAKLLKQDKALKNFYDQLSPSAKNDIAKNISEPKSAAGRQRRAEQIAERMMLAMEGELEPPPILQIAFRRNPGAAAAWQALTPVQRRGHLLGIFYYQSPEAREKRAAKAVDEALKLAKSTEDS